jgi:hypothetical protein
MKKPPIAKRIAELQAEAAGKYSLSREAYIKSLVEMYEAKPGDASVDNPRCDVLITRGQKHAVFPQKLAVGAQLSKLVGGDRPTEVRGGGGDRVDQPSWQALFWRRDAGRRQQSGCHGAIIEQWRARQGNKRFRYRHCRASGAVTP